MVTSPTPVEIFCSYAHEDETWLRKLETHLSLLKRQGLISLWHDRLISPGTDWAKSIDTHLETASVILFLVSADFFASDYCYGIEMKRALVRQEVGEAQVVPILVRPVSWKDAPFAHLQTLPTDAKPLASWQDEDAALTDVTSGIRRVIEDVLMLSASAPRAALPAIWNIPYPRNPFFLGRESELAQMHQRLQAGQTTVLSHPLAISGLGGIGKTQLVLEYAYRYSQDYQAVLWARAESTEAVISSYITIASLLRLQERGAKEHHITVQAVKTWLLTYRHWLLILDNADELTVLADFLPPSLGGHLILTTRAIATGRLAQRLEIETLDPSQGALLLLRRAGLIASDAELSQVSLEERKLAVQISQGLGGLPLALDQAGAYLEETGIDLANYWYLYQQHRADLLSRRGGLVADHPESVATTWSLSFHKIEEKNPAAADLLRMLAFLSPDAIAEEILTASTSQLGTILAQVAANTFLLNQAIEALRAYSLVRRDPRRKTLSIHRLVQAVLQDRLEEMEKRLWVERILFSVNAAFPFVAYDAWAQCERLLPQALIATQLIEQYQIMSNEAGRLLYETASYLQDRVRYAEAEPLYLRALQIREQILGPEHLDVTYPLGGLADLCRRQGRYAEAEPLYLRALQIREQILGPEHPDVATSLNGLANLYRNQDKDMQAEPLYLRALRIQEQMQEPLHPDVAFSLCHLADLYRDQGRYAEAELLYLRALHIREQMLEPIHPNIAYSLCHLADFYRDQSRYVEAEPLYLRALQIREQRLGLGHPRTATALNGLANLYRDQGKYIEAEPLYLQALQIIERVLGSEHPETAEIIHDLARLREVQDNSEEARICYIRALTVRTQALGAQHSKTMETHTRLIALLHVLRQHEEAVRLEAIQSEP